MFGFLKKKISEFVGKVTGKTEEKKEEPGVEEKQPLPAKEPHTPPQQPIVPEPQLASAEQLLPKTEEKPVAPLTRVIEKPKPPEVREEKKEFAPRVGLLKKITSVFSGEIELSEKELGNVFEDLELSLLEADASLETSQFMVENLRSRLVGKKAAKREITHFVNDAVQETLLGVFSFSTPSSPFFSLVEKSEKPFVVLFVGPNGAGKTTTIAKLAHQLKQRGFTSVISASDTFRAAAIQQAEHHGEKIGVKVVKHSYGSDPAAVAFDAVSHAKSRTVDVVLIDTAGRQETNVNLVEEMKKINRVVKPHMCIFVGETLAGHAVIEQVKKFHEAIKLDGLILTKLDCDAKGGNALSIAHDLKIPIYFIGLGQEYGDLVEFVPSILVSRILAE